MSNVECWSSAIVVVVLCPLIALMCFEMPKLESRGVIYDCCVVARLARFLYIDTRIQAIPVNYILYRGTSMISIVPSLLFRNTSMPSDASHTKIRYCLFSL